MTAPAANCLLMRYKREASSNPAVAAAPIAFRGRVMGRLEPALVVPAVADLERICAWRNASRGKFFSEHESTPASTRRWIESVSENTARILFFVVLERHGIVGHIGLTDVREPDGTAETDSWLGDGDAHVPGILVFGFAALLRWSFETLRLRTVTARVFSDNGPVLRAHALLGYALEDEIGMRRIEDAAGVRWEEDAAATGRRISRLRLTRDAFDRHTTQWTRGPENS